MHAQAFFTLVDPRPRPHGHGYRLQPLAASRRTPWTPRSLYPHEPRASRPHNPARTTQTRTHGRWCEAMACPPHRHRSWQAKLRPFHCPVPPSWLRTSSTHRKHSEPCGHSGIEHLAHMEALSLPFLSLDQEAGLGPYRLRRWSLRPCPIRPSSLSFQARVPFDGEQAHAAPSAVLASAFGPY